MTPTLKSVIDELVAQHGALALFRRDTSGSLCEAGPEALLARTPAAEVLAMTRVKVGKGEDAGEVATELLYELGNNRLPRGVTRTVAEQLATAMLDALLEQDPEGEGLALALVEAFGETVLSVTWDGGGMANGVETIQRVGSAYWYQGDGGTLGPVATLTEAAETYVGQLTSATLAIRSTELTIDELPPLYPPDDSVEPGQKVIINGAEFIVNDDLRLERVGKRKKR
jgi:hypothetical protein